MTNLEHVIKVWDKDSPEDADEIIPLAEFPITLFRFLTDTEWGIETYWEIYSTGLDSTIAMWVKSAQSMVDEPDAYFEGDEGTEDERVNLGYPNNITLNSIREWMLNQ